PKRDWSSDVCSSDLQVNRDNRATAHCINITEGICRSDPTPVIGGVDHRSKKICRRQNGSLPIKLYSSGVVAVVDTHQNMVIVLTSKFGHGIFEFTRWNLTGTSTAGGSGS